MKNLLIALALLASLFTNAYAQQDAIKPEAKPIILSVEEIKTLLFAKTIKFDSGQNGMCNITFAKNGYAFSNCAGGSGSGTYDFGMFNTKGGTDGTTRPRFCVRYNLAILGTQCSIVYKRADGSYSTNADKTPILEIKDE